MINLVKSMVKIFTPDRDYKIFIYKDLRKEWRWRLVASNGKIIANGESYKNKKDMLSILRKMFKKYEIIEL